MSTPHPPILLTPEVIIRRIVAGSCDSRIRAAFVIHELREAGVDPAYPFHDVMRVAAQLADELEYMVELQEQLHGLHKRSGKGAVVYLPEPGHYRIFE